MKDHRTVNCVILLLVGAITLSNVDQLEALSVAETCLIVKNATFIGDPTDCQGWVYCLNGEPYYGKCKDGYLYDSASGVCDYPSRVSCTGNVTTMCTGQTNIYKPDPFNCQNYCYCKDGVSACTNCPAGQNYNQSTQSCMWAVDSPCQPSSPCLLAQNGFVKDTTSCSGWFRCASGAVVASGNCNETAGLYYDASSGECGYNVPCSLAPGSTPGNAPPTPSNPCSTWSATTPFVGDGATCRGYFYCTSATDDAPVWAQCPTNSNFNIAEQQCNLPYDVNCQYNRCEGTTNVFMTVPGSGCLDYYVCNNGLNGTVTPCPSPWLNFNEAAQACQTAAVNLAICG